MSDKQTFRLTSRIGPYSFLSLPGWNKVLSQLQDMGFEILEKGTRKDFGSDIEMGWAVVRGSPDSYDRVAEIRYLIDNNS